MPQITFSSSVAAGATTNLMANQQYQYLPWAARVKALVRATATTLRLTVWSGSETIQPESPIQGGGTAGTTPTDFTTPAIVWDAAAGDFLQFQVRSTDAGAQTVDAIIYFYPL